MKWHLFLRMLLSIKMQKDQFTDWSTILHITYRYKTEWNVYHPFRNLIFYFFSFSLFTRRVFIIIFKSNMFKALTSNLRQSPKCRYNLFTNEYSFYTVVYEKTCFALLIRDNVKLYACNLLRSIELLNLDMIKKHFTLFMNIEVKMYVCSLQRI